MSKDNSPYATQSTFGTRLTYIQSNGLSPPQQQPYLYPSPFYEQDQGPSHLHMASAISSGNVEYGHPSASSDSLVQNPAASTHPGCVLCGLVRSCQGSSSSPTPSSQDPYSTPHTPMTASPTTETSLTDDGTILQSPHCHPFEPRSPSQAPIPVPSGRRGGRRVGGRDIIYHDKDITVYRAENNERLCDGNKHIIIVVNEHLQSVYEFGASDIPLLSHILDTATQILHSAAAASNADVERGHGKDDVQVGFVGSIFKDPQSPYAHLHAHAYLPPINTKLAGASFWRRKVIFGPLNWWSVQDLRAEIREATSNNRIKTGYQHREAPIDHVPDAGSVVTPANAFDARYSDLPLPETPTRSDTLQHPSQHHKKPTQSPFANSHPLAKVSSIGSDLSVSTVTPQTGTQSEGGKKSGEAVQLPLALADTRPV
nr:hypothetical protein L203_02906 [Cryptococcus depauperatus CBS 7841]